MAANAQTDHDKFLEDDSSFTSVGHCKLEIKDCCILSFAFVTTWVEKWNEQTSSSNRRQKCKKRAICTMVCLNQLSFSYPTQILAYKMHAGNQATLECIPIQSFQNRNAL